MEYDKSKVYTALNADELKVGSKVIVADTLDDLKSRVRESDTSNWSGRLLSVCTEDHQHRFQFKDENNYSLAYLVDEPEGLKWTDLKVGDVIRLNVVDRDTLRGYTIERMITEIDGHETDACHIRAGIDWLTDEELKYWEKVEND